MTRAVNRQAPRRTLWSGRPMNRKSSLLRSVVLFVLLCLSAGGLSACSGGEGAVCQLSGDCSSGFVCCKGSASLTDRGTCAVTCGATDAGPRDLGATDLGGADLGAPDLGSADLGSADLGADDLGAVDAGEPDAGMSEDLGPADMSVALDML